MLAFEHYPALEVWGPMEEQTQNRPVIDQTYASDAELWDSVPSSIRCFIGMHDIILQQSRGVAFLIDSGARPGNRYAASHPPYEHCNRDIHEWVRRSEGTYTALVVLTGRGNAPVRPIPWTTSALVLGIFAGDSYGNSPEMTDWTLQVPGRCTPHAQFRTDPIALDKQGVEALVAEVRRVATNP